MGTAVCKHERVGTRVPLRGSRYRWQRFSLPSGAHTRGQAGLSMLATQAAGSVPGCVHRERRGEEEVTAGRRMPSPRGAHAGPGKPGIKLCFYKQRGSVAVALAEVSSGLSLLAPLMLCVRCGICAARQLPTPAGSAHGAGSRAGCTMLPSSLSRLRTLLLAVSAGAGCLLGVCRGHLACSRGSGVFGPVYRFPVVWQEGATRRSWPRTVGEH